MPACPNCSSTDLVRIDLQPPGGLLRFAACRRCEHRWWTRPGQPDTVALGHIVKAVTPSTP